MTAGGWEIDGVHYAVNPRSLVDEGLLETARIYLHCRDGWGGLAHLPDSGGMLDQAAIMMDAFAELASAFGEKSRKKPKP